MCVCGGWGLGGGVGRGARQLAPHLAAPHPSPTLPGLGLARCWGQIKGLINTPAWLKTDGSDHRCLACQPGTPTAPPTLTLHPTASLISGLAVPPPTTPQRLHLHWLSSRGPPDLLCSWLADASSRRRMCATHPCLIELRSKIGTNRTSALVPGFRATEKVELLTGTLPPPRHQGAV